MAFAVPLAKRWSRLLRECESHFALFEDIQRANSARPRFLLARLHVDQLAAMVVPAQVKSALSKMFKVSQHGPRATDAYDEQYDLALERISTQPAYQADLARATLA